MDIQATAQLLGNFGEFVGAIAVVVTLGYLAVQVRHSREATDANTKSVAHSEMIARAQVRSAITDQIIQINSLIFREPTLFDAQLKSIRGLPVDETEASRLGALAFLWFKHAENVHYQYRHGLYDEVEFQAQRNIWRDRFKEVAWQKTFQARKDHLSPEFVEAIEEVLLEIRE
jgi:hypothetical protein